MPALPCTSLQPAPGRLSFTGLQWHSGAVLDARTAGCGYCQLSSPDHQHSVAADAASTTKLSEQASRNTASLPRPAPGPGSIKPAATQTHPSFYASSGAATARATLQTTARAYDTTNGVDSRTCAALYLRDDGRKFQKSQNYDEFRLRIFIAIQSGDMGLVEGPLNFTHLKYRTFNLSRPTAGFGRIESVAVAAQIGVRDCRCDLANIGALWGLDWFTGAGTGRRLLNLIYCFYSNVTIGWALRCSKSLFI